jgi:N-ethylmaleimide reductase
LEVAREIADVIGKDKVGIRLSPHGVAGDMIAYDEIDATYAYLAEELGKIGIAYIHVVDHSSMGAPEVPLKLKQTLREKFNGTFILAGGYDWQKAEHDLSSDLADLIGFGRPFINNPDLIERLTNNLPLNLILDASTFYTATEKGYTDYPVYADETIAA